MHAVTDALIKPISSLSLSRENHEELQTKTYELWLTLLQSPYLSHMRPGSTGSGLHRIAKMCTTQADKVSLLVLSERLFQVQLYTIENQHPTFEATLILDGPMTFTLVAEKRSLIPVSKIEDLFEALKPVYGAPLLVEKTGKSCYDLGQSLLHQKFTDLTFLKRLYKHQCSLASFTYSEEAIYSDRLFLGEFRRAYHLPSPVMLDTFPASKLCLSHQYYVVSESPKRETLISFWDAVIKSKASLVVSFFDDFRYWDTPMRSTDWKISLSSTEDGEIIKRTFCVVSHGEERFITHLECRLTAEKETQNILMNLLSVIGDHRQECESGTPIWIHGSSSIGRLATVAVADNICCRILQAGVSGDQIMCNPRLDITSARMQHCDAVHPNHISILHRLYEHLRAATTTSV